MAATTGGYEWAGSSPMRHHSPDTTSPMYPDRPIRPLPKRRLRARLSPEQAQSIVFPPAPPSSGPLFSFPYSQIENRSVRVGQQRGENDHHRCHCGANHSEVESDEEEDERAAGLPSSPTFPYDRRVASKGMSGGPSYPKAGSASSADGYESFENTNNKKKRKIPNMGSASMHQASLAAEMANMGISRAHELLHDYGEGASYSGSNGAPQSPSGTGISGAGRGRFGRSGSARAERRVLSSSVNGANAKTNAKRDLGRQPPSTGEQGGKGGIISAAIANAQASTPTSQTGNENVSLIQQEAAKPNNKQTQFTFTCGSDSATKMVWPGQQNGSYPAPPGAYPQPVQTVNTGPAPLRTRPPVRPDAPMVNTQGTQTSPNLNGTAQPGAPKPQAQPKAGGQPSQNAQQQPQQQQPAPRKPRRSAAKMYAYAARKRREQQEYANSNHHPVPGEMWICEFCEYEDIFGEPPVALIRQYEIKDRKERKRLAEKRRLLEKARMKGRKGKKASKKAQNNANNQQNNQNPPATRRADESSLDPQDEEYYDDSYDDGVGEPCSNHCPHHGHHGINVKGAADTRGAGGGSGAGNALASAA